MDPLLALTLASLTYAALLAATYVVLLAKSPKGYRRPKAKELAVLAAFPLLFFVLGYLLLVAIQ
ncbi:MAG: hypothetical protein ACK4SY_05245 [Pyrobaculum sp.]